MSCETLEVSTGQVANPSGALIENARPEASCICRDYDFGGTNWITTISAQAVIYTIGGIPMRTIR